MGQGSKLDAVEAFRDSIGASGRPSAEGRRDLRSPDLTPWESLIGQERRPYQCADFLGETVRVSPKFKENHSSWEDIQADPAYHYNLNVILSNPDAIMIDVSSGEKTKKHRETGTILTYVKYNYIQDINTPASYQYPNDRTEVVVKYNRDWRGKFTGEAFTLTSMVFKNTERVGAS